MMQQSALCCIGCLRLWVQDLELRMLLYVSNETCTVTQRIGVTHNIIAVNLVVADRSELNHRDLHRRGRRRGYGDAGRLVS